jgi:hypothetical protein
MEGVMEALPDFCKGCEYFTERCLFNDNNCYLFLQAIAKNFDVGTIKQEKGDGHELEL